KQSLIGKVQNGKTYKLSGWVRLENSNSDNIILSIEMEDDNPAKYSNLETLTCSNTEWTELSGEFTPSPSGTLKTLDIYFEGPAADVNFFVDDVSVSEVAAAPAAAQPEPNTPAKVEPKAPKAEPNAPKAEPNAPPKHVKAKAPAAKMSTINDSTVVNTKNEAVIGSQKQ
ncbi:MAG: carbohydrate binding domain-containing protein, partial [Sedimentisphaerales bacterium]